AKGAPRERIDGEGRAVAGLDAADVALADIGVDLHLREVGRDQEQRRRLEARRHGLTDGDVARDDGAVHRRYDVGIAEIDLGRLELRLTLLDGRSIDADLRPRLVERVPGNIERVLGDGIGLCKPRVTVVVDLRVIEIGP